MLHLQRPAIREVKRFLGVCLVLVRVLADVDAVAAPEADHVAVLQVHEHVLGDLPPVDERAVAGLRHDFEDHSVLLLLARAGRHGAEHLQNLKIRVLAGYSRQDRWRQTWKRHRRSEHQVAVVSPSYSCPEQRKVENLGYPRLHGRGSVQAARIPQAHKALWHGFPLQHFQSVFTEAKGRKKGSIDAKA